MMPELPPFKNTELPNPGMLELIALCIYCPTPRRTLKGAARQQALGGTIRATAAKGASPCRQDVA
jgi:hypothetical protein